MLLKVAILATAKQKKTQTLTSSMDWKNIGAQNANFYTMLPSAVMEFEQKLTVLIETTAPCDMIV